MRRNDGLRWRPPGRVGTTLSGFLILVAILLVMGCQDSLIKQAPAEIVGTWEADDPRFKGCTMEITPNRIVFGNPVTGMTRNYITMIRKSPEGTRTLYEISYENAEELDYLLPVYYIRSGEEEILRLKNRDEVKWTRTLVPGL
jgi:hypothetical protein